MPATAMAAMDAPVPPPGAFLVRSWAGVVEPTWTHEEVRDLMAECLSRMTCRGATARCFVWRKRSPGWSVVPSPCAARLVGLPSPCAARL